MWAILLCLRYNAVSTIILWEDLNEKSYIQPLIGYTLKKKKKRRVFGNEVW